METLPVKAEGLFEQNLVLHCPLVRKRREVWEVGQRLVDIVFVPEEHPQSLKTEMETGSSDRQAGLTADTHFNSKDR